ncbi:MAG TPA: extradiol ring-cleavage dioxygenase [Candidatus Binatia bacterium]
MAEIVLGLGTSHSPQLSIPWTEWNLLREKDETDPRLDYPALLKSAAARKPGLEADLTQEKWRERDEACQKAIARVGDLLRAAKPDLVLVFGDDQQEQFHDDNMPTFALYHGKALPVVKHTGRNPARWKEAEERGWAETAPEYENGWELAQHLISSLTADEFDVARCNKLRAEIGVGHAFSFLYRRVWPGGTVPSLPLMVNTYYPPNQPTPKRCYALGQAIRRGVESWKKDARVVLMASGGLSHVVIDEELDQVVIEGLMRKKRDLLFSLPRPKLKGGTSEILNWVALAGAMESAQMDLIDYIPTYRSLAATGCGMAFASWR